MEPLLGRLLTSWVRTVPVFRLNKLLLPVPVVPTYKWYWEPVPALQLNVAEVPTKTEPGVGLVISALLGPGTAV